MNNSITLEALHVLDAIARRGSFAAAAQELNRAPSSLSYQVQKLEQDLDLVIFDRSGHKAVFTQAGQFILERGRALIAASNELISDANILAHGWELDVTIAYDCLIPIRTFFPLLNQLEEQSKTRLKLQEETLAGNWEALSYDRADILICPKPEHLPIDVKVDPLGELNMIWVAAPDHIVHKRTADFDQQARLKYRAIVIADTARTSPTLTKNLLDEQPRLTVSNFNAKIEALCMGLGIGTMPENVATPLIEKGLLQKIHGTNDQAMELVIAWRRNKMGKAKSWCIQYLKKHWKQDYLNSNSCIYDHL
ncbi:LysR family transcriptional regulator [Vibrio gangliei]|uniref:LysR family transcriptional regulator n=1 Tax=Vibrio gangliei TaxID=2077090 RepID=UPI000D014088|nr:LysR family transcriptional regulator [Vibrio gangliei]